MPRADAPFQTKDPEPDPEIARIYDPIGIAAALLIRAKIGLQELWKRGISWDEVLPIEVSEKWLRLFKEMVKLNETSFNRCLTPPDTVGRPTLCIFLTPLRKHLAILHMQDGN